MFPIVDNECSVLTLSCFVKYFKGSEGNNATMTRDPQCSKTNSSRSTMNSFPALSKVVVNTIVTTVVRFHKDLCLKELPMWIRKLGSILSIPQCLDRSAERLRASPQTVRMSTCIATVLPQVNLDILDQLIAHLQK